MTICDICKAPATKQTPCPDSAIEIKRVHTNDPRDAVILLDLCETCHGVLITRVSEFIDNERKRIK